jgi:ABC-2 type transport system ATP-binding protein
MSLLAVRARVAGPHIPCVAPHTLAGNGRRRLCLSHSGETSGIAAAGRIASRSRPSAHDLAEGAALLQDEQAQPAFRGEQLGKTFQGRPVIDGLDISVPWGAALGLLGSNGVGKSTLLKLLLGLLTPDAGNAFVAGERVDRMSSRMRARIGYVPQTPWQFAWLTGRAMLAYVHSFYPSIDSAYTARLIERFGVVLDTPIKALSAGQQQRLSIVRALAARPDLMVLDEPIASLDPAIRMAVIEELQRLRQERSVTLIFSSHIVGDLQRLCSELVIMARGQLAVRAPMEQFTDLVRLTIAGPESALAAFDFTSCQRVRRPALEQRVVLVSRSLADTWRQSLPGSFRLIARDDALDSVVAEWMQ